MSSKMLPLQVISNYRPTKLRKVTEDAPGVPAALQELVIQGGRGEAAQYIVEEAQRGIHWNLSQNERSMSNKNAARDAKKNAEASEEHICCVKRSC